MTNAVRAREREGIRLALVVVYEARDPWRAPVLTSDDIRYRISLDFPSLDEEEEVEVLVKEYPFDKSLPRHFDVWADPGNFGSWWKFHEPVEEEQTG